MNDEGTAVQSGNLSTGAIVATAVGAGLIAFMIRRARRADEERLETAAEVAAAAWERARESDLKNRTASAARDFVVERLLPELKPVLLELLSDFEDYIDKAFKRAEKTVKDL